MSRKRVKHVYPSIISIFFKKIKKHVLNFNKIIFNVIVPKKNRKAVLKLIYKTIRTTEILKKKKLTKKKTSLKNKKKFLKKKQKNLFKNLLIRLIPKKCFNGCQVKKGKKKKENTLEYLNNKYKL